VFKVENFNDLEIFNDYFDPAKLNKRMNRKPQATTTKSLLIERGQHYCKIKDFTKNLAVMYDHESEEQQNKLLLCKDLDIKKENELHGVSQKSAQVLHTGQKVRQRVIPQIMCLNLT